VLLKLEEMVKSGALAVSLEPEMEKKISTAVVDSAKGM
jgi:hypothetical protein